MIQYYY